MASKRPPLLRKKPTQSRARVTFDSILQAASQLLPQLGFEGFSTDRVAERAGVSVGTLYQYFKNKDALCSALLDQMIEEEVAALNLEPADLKERYSLEEAVQILISRLVAIHSRNPGLRRLLIEFAERLASADTKRDILKRVSAKLVDFFQVYPQFQGRPRAELELKSFVLVHSIEAVLHEAVIRGLGAPQAKQLETELVLLVMGYLGAPAKPRTSSRRG